MGLCRYRTQPQDTVEQLPVFATFASAAASFYEKQYPSLDLAVPVITLITTVTAGVIAHFKFAEKEENYKDLAESCRWWRTRKKLDNFLLTGDGG